MGTDMDLLYSGSNFSSKEISFIKSDSDAISDSDFTPKQYLSDSLFEQDGSNNQWLINLDTFIKELLLKLDQRGLSEESDTILGKQFTCAVVRLRCEDGGADGGHGFRGADLSDPSMEMALSTGSIRQELCHGQNSHIREALVDAINSAIPHQSGIWQWLSESTLIIAIWGDPFLAEETVRDLIRLISTTPETVCHAGAARFPFMDLLPKMVAYNAVKALDHSAFFGPGVLTFFDDVTQNIYGDRLYQFGKIEEAAIEYEKGLEIRDDNINLLNSLGVCYSLMNRLEPALDRFKKAIELKQSNILQQKGLELRSDAESQSQPAGKQKRSHIGQDDSEFMLLYNAALISNLMDDVGNGISYIKKATEINRCVFEAELTAGILMLKAHMPEDALIHLDHAASLNPESAMVHRILGELYLHTALPSKAVHEYSRSVRLNPFDACALSGLAKAFEVQNKNLDIALDLALHSLIISPDNPWFRMRLARIYMKIGESESADIELSKAEELFKALKLTLKEEACSSLTSESAESEDKISSHKINMGDMKTFLQYGDEKPEPLKKKFA